LLEVLPYVLFTAAPELDIVHMSYLRLAHVLTLPKANSPPTRFLALGFWNFHLFSHS
jgi:hypothetical protein